MDYRYHHYHCCLLYVPVDFFIILTFDVIRELGHSEDCDMFSCFLVGVHRYINRLIG